MYSLTVEANIIFIPTDINNIISFSLECLGSSDLFSHITRWRSYRFVSVAHASVFVQHVWIWNGFRGFLYNSADVVMIQSGWSLAGWLVTGSGCDRIYGLCVPRSAWLRRKWLPWQRITVSCWENTWEILHSVLCFIRLDGIAISRRFLKQLFIFNKLFFSKISQNTIDNKI